MSRVARRIRVSGRVQGVAYRAWTVDQAQRLGIDGWVRNRRDGSVEIEAAGPADAIDALVEACRIGPPAARVGNVEVAPAADPVPPGAGFAQRPTE